MSFFKMLGRAAETFVGVRAVQSGSDVLINRHTGLNVFLVDKGLKAHAEALIEQYFKNSIGEPH